MMLTIVKIGGGILEDSTKRDLFLNVFVKIPGKKILVHGGGKLANKLAEQRGVKSDFLNGRRITSPEMLQTVTMVYAALNKELIASLQHKNCSSIGLCGADCGMIISKKRSPEPVDFGMVGDPVQKSRPSPVLSLLLNAGVTPVFSALTIDSETGTLLNTNADTIANTLAQQFAETHKVEVIYAFEHAGVMKDLKDENSLIRKLKKNEITSLTENEIIHSGMLPKLENGFQALASGAKKVLIAKFDNLQHGTTLVL